MNYFAGCVTVPDIKSRYRHLAMEHHPDHGGNTQVMQEINRQYLEALKHCDGSTTRDSEGTDHTYHYNESHETAIMDKIAELLRLRLTGCDIVLIGKWIWVSGNTREHREALKTAGLSWHSARLAWYWKPYTARTQYNERASLADLADLYGAKVFATAANSATAPMSAA